MCSWCGATIEADDGFRAYEPAGERRAAFCRLEHVVPWSIQGAHWEPGALDEPSEVDDVRRCSHCDAEHMTRPGSEASDRPIRTRRPNCVLAYEARLSKDRGKTFN